MLRGILCDLASLYVINMGTGDLLKDYLFILPEIAFYQLLE